MTKTTPTPDGIRVRVPAEDIGARLDQWATQLERAVAVLNETLTEIKRIKKEDPANE